MRDFNTVELGKFGAVLVRQGMAQPFPGLGIAGVELASHAAAVLKSASGLTAGDLARRAIEPFSPAFSSEVLLRGIVEMNKGLQ